MQKTHECEICVPHLWIKNKIISNENEFLEELYKGKMIQSVDIDTLIGKTFCMSRIFPKSIKVNWLLH